MIDNRDSLVMRNNGSRGLRSALGLACLALLLAPAVAARAADVSVWTIRGTMKNSEISEELKPLADALKRAIKYTGYKLVKKDRKAVEKDKSVAFSAIDGYTATIKTLAETDDKVELQIEVVHDEKGKKERKLKTTVNIRRGRFQIMGGWEIADKEVLILAVGPR